VPPGRPISKCYAFAFEEWPNMDKSVISSKWSIRRILRLPFFSKEFLSALVTSELYQKLPVHLEIPSSVSMLVHMIRRSYGRFNRILLSNHLFINNGN